MSVVAQRCTVRLETYGNRTYVYLGVRITHIREKLYTLENHTEANESVLTTMLANLFKYKPLKSGRVKAMPRRLVVIHNGLKRSVIEACIISALHEHGFTPEIVTK